MGDDNFGDRMRSMRKQRKMSLDQLAAATGLTKSYLSKVERKVAVPSITTALRVSKAFGIKVGQLFGEEVGDDAICVVRKGVGKRAIRMGSAVGYSYESIAAGRTFKAMEPFIMRPPHQYQTDTMFTHAGEEFVFVLSGQLEMEFSDRKVRLGPGDSVYFDSHIPHRARSVSDETAEALVVVTAG